MSEPNAILIAVLLAFAMLIFFGLTLGWQTVGAICFFNIACGIFFGSAGRAQQENHHVEPPVPGN